MSVSVSWDEHAVRLAFAQAQSLVDGFVSDLSTESFRVELEKVIAEALGPAEQSLSDELRDRVGLLLYGSAILGAAGLALGAELGGKTRADVRAMAGEAVNTWLDAES
jgi:hypothetical protein